MTGVSLNQGDGWLPTAFPCQPFPDGIMIRHLQASKPAVRQRPPSFSMPDPYEHPQPTKARTSPMASVCHQQDHLYQGFRGLYVREGLMGMVGFFLTRRPRRQGHGKRH